MAGLQGDGRPEQRFDGQQVVPDLREPISERGLTVGPR